MENSTDTNDRSRYGMSAYIMQLIMEAIAEFIKGILAFFGIGKDERRKQQNAQIAQAYANEIYDDIPDLGETNDFEPIQKQTRQLSERAEQKLLIMNAKKYAADLIKERTVKGFIAEAPEMIDPTHMIWLENLELDDLAKVRDMPIAQLKDHVRGKKNADVPEVDFMKTQNKMDVLKRHYDLHYNRLRAAGIDIDSLDIETDLSQEEIERQLEEFKMEMESTHAPAPRFH